VGKEKKKMREIEREKKREERKWDDGEQRKADKEEEEGRGLPCPYKILNRHCSDQASHVLNAAMTHKVWA